MESTEYPGYNVRWYPVPEDEEFSSFVARIRDEYEDYGLEVHAILSAHKFKKHPYDVYAPAEVDQYGIEVVWKYET